MPLSVHTVPPAVTVSASASSSAGTAATTSGVGATDRAGSTDPTVTASTLLFRELAAGSVAGVCEYTVCQPVDIVLTRRLLGGAQVGQQGLIGDMIGLLYEGGIGRLYRGLGPQVLAAVPATIGMYVGESYFGRLFEQVQGLSPAAKIGLAGACSGISETAAVCPFEVIKVRMQSKLHIGKYTGTFHCIRTVVKEEGFGALYNGGGPMLVRNCIFNGIFFSGSHYLRETVFKGTEQDTALENFQRDALCGLIMGAVATPPKMPFFVVKTRLQGGGDGARLNHMGTVDVMRLIVREEGVRGLWRGTGAAMVRMSLGCAVCLAAFRGLSAASD